MPAENAGRWSWLAGSPAVCLLRTGGGRSTDESIVSSPSLDAARFVGCAVSRETAIGEGCRWGDPNGCSWRVLRTAERPAAVPEARGGGCGRLSCSVSLSAPLSDPAACHVGSTETLRARVGRGPRAPLGPRARSGRAVGACLDRAVARSCRSRSGRDRLEITEVGVSEAARYPDFTEPESITAKSTSRATEGRPRRILTGTPMGRVLPCTSRPARRCVDQWPPAMSASASRACAQLSRPCG